MVSVQKNSIKPSNTQALNQQNELTDSWLWTQIKISNKNISRRSYHTAVVYSNSHYVFGGYDINTGIMDDFYKLNLQQSSVEWQCLTVPDTTVKEYPGKRYAHSAVAYKNRMVIFGGKTCSLKNTNSVHSYNFITQEWEIVKTNGSIPQIDSHSACLYKDQMLVFGGFFGQKIGKYSNSLYSLNLTNNTWTLIDCGKVAPPPRANTSCAVIGDQLFVFGGSDLNSKYNDLWKINLTDRVWHKVKTNQSPELTPQSRYGHTLTSWQGKLILFGGIHDITHQKNDVGIYSQGKWRIIQTKQQSVQVACEQNELVVSQLKKVEDLSRDTFKNKRYRQLKQTNYLNHSQGYSHAEKEAKSKQDIRKHNLLSEFQLTPEEREKFRNHSPTLESLKNSIMALSGSSSNAFKKHNIHDTQLNNLRKANQKKKPCARDGHSACVFGNYLVIFGGDRHMMGFNDMFLLDLSKFT